MIYMSKLTKRLALGRTAIALIALLAACSPTDVVSGPDDTIPPEIAAVLVLPESVSERVGRSVRLSVDVRDNQGHALQGESITWTSSDDLIATVDTTGTVQLVNTGAVEIRASVRGRRAGSRITVVPIPVASVTITPTPVSLQVGQQATLTASTRSSTDSVLTGRSVTWASGNPAVATVDASGLVTSLAAGSATISATSEGISGVASVTVTAIPLPGTVGDLSVSAIDDTSATMRFTDVGDGVGGPARYVVRYASPSISWATATNVARGTCVSPLSASALGAIVNCTIRGLAPGTGYRFQVRAYRGTIGTDAVYGTVSNIASGTTTVTMAAVASVTVAPGTATVVAGATQAFSATARDAGGNVLTGRAVTWSSTNTAVATVSATGVASGVGAGTSNIRATVGGVTNGATLTVSAPVATVASVTLTPSNTAIYAGASMAFAATARDVAGTILSGLAVTWSSTNTAVSTITSAGVATGLGAGTTTIRATVGGITGNATLTVSTTPATTGFLHEPAGFVTLGQWNNAAGLDANGWYDDGNPGTYGSKSRVTSGWAGAPSVGGAAAIQSFYAAGVLGGHDPGRMQFNLPSGTDEIYFGAEVQFKYDYPTARTEGGNKQFFVSFSGGGRYFVNFDLATASANRWGIFQQSSPLMQSTIPVVYGQWVKVEWYLKKDTGTNNGIMRLWIDGVLAVERTDLVYPTGSMTMAYDDGSNNGNHLVEGDARTIRYEHGAAVDAFRWVSALKVMVPQP